MGLDDILIVAGEASGDLHAGRLLEELTRLHPTLKPFGMGGPQLREAGLDTIADSSEIAVVGITEAFRILPTARRIFRELVAAVEEREPRCAILVDSPEFNLRLAKALAGRGVQVVYYVSPQVWAWRAGRVRGIRKLVDRMLVLFPFEVDFYRRHGVEVTHVGHPLVDEVPVLPHIWDEKPPEPARIVLLPGSRRSEVWSNFDVMLDAARLISQDRPTHIRVIRASGLDRAVLDEHIKSHDVEVEVVDGERFSVLARSHLALCASGTATLEVGLIGTPLIVVYRVARWTSVLGRLVLRLRHVSLVNLVLGREVVPELLQANAEATKIASTAIALLDDRERVEQMRRELTELRGQLGESGASARAASVVKQILDEAA